MSYDLSAQHVAGAYDSVDTLACPFDELSPGLFPENLTVVIHERLKKFGCYADGGTYGLAVFRSENAALRFAEWIELSGCTTKDVTFDESRQIAKERPYPVCCLILCDRLDLPKGTYPKVYVA